MIPADDDGRVYVVDLGRVGMPPLAIHVDQLPGEPVALHCGGPVAGAVPALRQTNRWKNPRRAVAIAAGAAGALTLFSGRRRRRGSRGAR